MNGGEVIARVLQEWQVRVLFTLSGGHIAPIYVEAEKLGIQIVDVRDEATAVFSADAMGRLSGIPGIAVVTAGPGVTNTVTALKNAQLAESPVVLIGGAAATLLRGRGALQDIDQLALMRPLVKWAARVSRLKDLQVTLRKALNKAVHGVPGPVFIECPMDLLYDEQMVRELYTQQSPKTKSLRARALNWYIRRHVNQLFSGPRYVEPRSAVDLTYGSPVPQDKVNAAMKMIDESKRPVLLMGSGATKNPIKIDDLSTAVSRLGIPVYLSGMARGLLGNNCPHQFFHQRTKALKDSDCLILAGVPCDFRLNYGRHFRSKALKIAISRSKSDLTKNLQANCKILCDPTDVLLEMAKKGRDYSNRWFEWRTTLQEREADREASIENTRVARTDYINPIALLKTLEDQLPQKSVIIVDGGDFAASASYILKPRGPLKWLDPGVFGTLGSGGGFALGAALQYPDHYVWIIYGDGSAAYSLMELDTFRKFELKVCGIVGNNGSWEQIARDQIHILGRNTASTLPRSDYEKIALAFDTGGEKVESLGQFQKSVKNAIAHMDKGLPYLINSMIGSTDFRKGSMSM